jgi:Chaperone of endosialidase
MAANYDLPDVVEKRVRFFDGQFLQDQDFVDEQKYHLDRMRRHNKLLHVAGIADGLDVTSAGANALTVAPGTAIDSDGRQLVLGQPLPVDLAAETFNNRRGIKLYLAYKENPVDPQTEEGTENDTRWQERPEVVVVIPGQSYAGVAPPVLLAEVALDDKGAATVDTTGRQYSGVRLAGPGADVPAIRSTAAGGTVDISGSLTIDGALTVNGRVSVANGVIQRGGAAITNTNDLGLYSQVDLNWIRVVTTNAPIRFFTDGGIGTAPRLTVNPDGNVGVGTPSPGARLEVVGGGGTSVDLVVNGRLRSNSNDGGLWVMADRFVGGFGTGQVGFFNGDWRLSVANNGNVAVGFTKVAAARLSVVGSGANELAGNAQSGVLRVSAAALGTAAGNEAALSSTGLTVTNNLSFGVRAIRAAQGTDWRTVAIGLGMDVDDTVRAGASLFLHANGNLGIGTTTPSARLSIVQPGATELAGNAQSPALRITSGALGTAVNSEAALSSTGLTVTNSLSFGVRAVRTVQGTDWRSVAIGLGMDVDNTVRAGASLFLHANTNVGIGTNNPAARLEVVGGGGTSVDLLVNGRLRSNNDDGGLWVKDDRFVGGLAANQIGFWNNGQWRLAVANNGTVGIGTTQQDANLHVYNPAQGTPVRMLRLDAQGFQTMDNARASHFLLVRDIGAGGAHFAIRGDGNVSIGSIDPGANRLSVRGGNTYLEGALYVNGPLNYFWGPDGVWKNVQNRGGDYAGSYTTGGPPSDLRLKTALRPIRGALDAVLRLTGMRYRWAEAGVDHLTRDTVASVSAGPGATEEDDERVRLAERRRASEELAGDHIGLVAQDVEPIVPEVVYEDDTGYKHIRYQQLTALLVEGIKEQHALVQALSDRLAALEAVATG